MTTATEVHSGTGERPWQLRMFSVSIKKKQKLNSLVRHLAPPVAGDCLLVTCGDNNGALNHHLRATGGDWAFCELEPQNIPEMESFLGASVQLAEPGELPYADGSFDTIVTIDCHEHLDDPAVLNRELARVLRPGGRAIVTVPNGNGKKLVTRLKHLMGMDAKRYGHKVIGSDVPALETMAREVEMDPVASSSYSGFFTELLELMINFAYMRVLAGKSVRDGQIAPTTQDQLRKVEKTYRMYRFVYPFVWLFSKLDVLMPFGRGYAVVVESVRRPA